MKALAALAALLLPLHGAAGHIADSRGRTVLLRGVNVNALAEYWKGTPLRTTFPLAPRDPERMAAIGWDAVRLLVSWSRVEPQPGRYDSRYLDRVAGAVAALRRAGLYAIVDFHQDSWGPATAAPAGQSCAPPMQPAIGWDGAPAWATLDDGLPRCFTQQREANPAVHQAWQSFFSNRSGIQDRYVAMIAHVARRFARTASVAGYDLMNEPNSFGTADDSRLSAMYGRALAAVRAAERAAHGFPHLVLFEPSVLWSADVRLAPPSFPHDANVVYAPHIYTGGFNGGAITRVPFDDARDQAEGFGDVPVLSGEWGTDPARTDYLVAHQALQDQYLFSATLWTWRESCGDPHKVGDYRAGRVPTVWGEWKVSCAPGARRNVPTGMRTATVRALTRAYVRAAPGLASTSYSDATGRFVARGTARRGAPAVVAFYPRAKHDGMRLRLTGLSLRHLRILPGGGRLIEASPRGGAWALAVS